MLGKRAVPLLEVLPQIELPTELSVLKLRGTTFWGLSNLAHI